MSGTVNSTEDYLARLSELGLSDSRSKQLGDAGFIAYDSRIMEYKEASDISGNGWGARKKASARPIVENLSRFAAAGKGLKVQRKLKKKIDDGGMDRLGVPP
jgi:hypothetical protein